MSNIFAKFFINFTFKALYVKMGKADSRVLLCQCKTLDIYKQSVLLHVYKTLGFNKIALKSNCYRSQINKFKYREGLNNLREIFINTFPNSYIYCA